MHGFKNYIESFDVSADIAALCKGMKDNGFTYGDERFLILATELEQLGNKYKAQMVKKSGSTDFAQAVVDSGSQGFIGFPLVHNDEFHEDVPGYNLANKPVGLVYLSVENFPKIRHLQIRLRGNRTNLVVLEYPIKSSTVRDAKSMMMGVQQLLRDENTENWNNHIDFSVDPGYRFIETGPMLNPDEAQSMFDTAK